MQDFCTVGLATDNIMHVVIRSYCEFGLLPETQYVSVKIIAISDINSLFPNKMCNKSIWRLGVTNPQTMWQHKG